MIRCGFNHVEILNVILFYIYIYIYIYISKNFVPSLVEYFVLKIKHACNKIKLNQ
jgi:hypothetical protein